jgi:transposase
MALHANTYASAKSIARDLNKTKNRSVSVRTVRRTLVDMGLKFGPPRRVPALSEQQKSMRVEWCKKNRKMDLADVFFSDETCIEVGGGNGGIWHQRGHQPTVPKKKFPTKLMFWAAISTITKSPLIAIKGTLDSQRYTDMVEGNFLRWLREEGHNISNFQQDNAPCHVSKLSRAFFGSQNIDLLDWPPNSPDLNPIENIWSILKSNVGKLNSTNPRELEDFAMQEWAKIPQSLIRRTILSLPSRCKQVVDRAGEKCDY